MRNFKKFLALVLAMLMVSACAVSVSATFADQAAIDKTDYAEAIEMLELLGIVKGDENKNFNPENTLRRDEAAVMVSKLVAGAAGQSMDWTAATTKFADVDAEWSFAYINYVADRKIMVGTDKGFEPTRELQIDEAITLALKAANPSAIREAEILYAQAPTSYWATYYIAAAEDMGLADGLGVIYDYEAACSKAMFAQIIFNVLTLNTAGENEEPEYPFLDKFDIAVVEGKITAVNSESVIVDPVVGEEDLSVNLAAFNAKLEEGTAADYIDHNVTITYSVENNTIYEVEITTTAKTFIYSDAKLANAKDADGNAVADKLVLFGTTYVVGNAGSNTTVNGGIGGGTSTTNYIEAEGLAAGMVPTYYKATAFDDNADGKYDRLDVDTYEIAKLVKGTEQTVTRDGKEVKVFGTTVDYIDDEVANDINDALLTMNGADFTAWGEAPVLVNVAENVITIIETAKTVTGTVSNIKDGSYIYVGGNKYDFAGNAFVAPEAWVLAQNITIYTINGKYVAVASADTGVTSGMVTKDVLVDNVTLEGDVAVITGYEFSGSALAPITLKVIGAETNGRLKTAPFGLKSNAFTDDGVENDIDYNKDGKFDAADNAFTAVALGSYNSENKFVPGDKLFADKTFYTFQVTSAGAYLAETQNNKVLPATSPSTGAVTIDGSYIKVGGTAKMKLAAAYLIVADVEADTTKAYNFYSDTFSIALNGAIAANTNLTYVCVAADGSIVTDGSKDVALIYISDIAKAESTPTVEVLADDLSIVLIVAAESYSIDLNTYKAYDIFTGAEVYVTSTKDDIDANTYATVKGTEIVVAGTDWIGNHNIYTTAVIEGTPDSVHAFNSYLTGEKDDAAVAGQLTPKSDDANKVVFGLDNVKAMEMKDGKLVVDADFKISDLYNTGSVYGFINGGKVVIVPDFAE